MALVVVRPGSAQEMGTQFNPALFVGPERVRREASPRGHLRNLSPPIDTDDMVVGSAPDGFARVEEFQEIHRQELDISSGLLQEYLSAAEALLDGLRSAR